MEQTELNKTYTDVTNEYIRLFTEKQDCKSYEWLNGYGSILECDLGGKDKEYFSFEDIRFDVNNNVEKGAIREYMNELYKSGFEMTSYADYLIAKIFAS